MKGLEPSRVDLDTGIPDDRKPLLACSTVVKDLDTQDALFEAAPEPKPALDTARSLECLSAEDNQE